MEHRKLSTTQIFLNNDIEWVMAETGSHALHCPCCNTKLGSGIAKVPEMLEKGINVALGSDGAPSNNNLDMFIEMRLASTKKQLDGMTEKLQELQNKIQMELSKQNLRLQ